MPKGGLWHQANTVVQELRPGSTAYPPRLGAAGPTLYACGDVGVLRLRLVGIFASTKATGAAILRSLAWARSFSESNCAVISGFHSPLERECLVWLLRRQIPLIACPAREIATYRLPAEWREAVKAAQMLVLSPFRTERRMNAQTSAKRNALVAALADECVVLHASPGSATERLVAEIKARGKRIHAPGGLDNGESG